MLKLCAAAEAVYHQPAAVAVGGTRPERVPELWSQRSSPILRETGSWRALYPNDPASPQQPASSTSTS